MQLVCLLSLEVSVFIWLLLTRPYRSLTSNLLTTSLQGNVCLLLLFAGCFSFDLPEKHQIYLSFVYIGLYWTGIGMCLLRFAGGLQGKKELVEPQTAVTEVSRLDISSASGKIEPEEKILSQKPSDPYRKMDKPLPLTKIKPAAEDVSTANTVERQPGTSTWVNEWRKSHISKYP